MPISNRVWNANAIPSMFSEHIEPQPRLSPAQKQQMRLRRFEESFGQRLIRVLRAIWVSSSSLPLSTSLRVVDAVMRDKTVGVRNVLDPAHALAEPDGFCSILDDTSAVALMDVFERGAFVDSGVTSACCWAPKQRRLIRIETTHPQSQMPVNSSLNVDANFDDTVTLCSAARSMSYAPKLLHGFCGLFDAGMAHSFDMRDGSGKNVAALFGVAVGRTFVVQGLYAATDADQQALMQQLIQILQERKFLFVDITPVPQLNQSQAIQMERTQFTTMLVENLAHGHLGRWRTMAPTQKDYAIAA